MPSAKKAKPEAPRKVPSPTPSDPHGFFAALPGDDDEVGPQLHHQVLVAGRVVADRYELKSRIARGGMATIWEAFDVRLGRTVAIKFIGRAYLEDPEYRGRFAAEAKAAAGLRSPYVVQIYDYGTASGVPFIAMERLVGEDLHARLLCEGRLSLEAAARVAREAGHALEAAHAAKIIHRDLKPQNLFLSQESQGEVLKLLDFGVAKHAGTAGIMTATGVMLGSPFYMSPEQVRCERDLDVRTDLWSLAAILYRAITGVKPFDGEISRVLYLITNEPPLRPSVASPDLPPAIDAFFLKALAVERDRRFASAAELVASFEARALG